MIEMSTEIAPIVENEKKEDFETSDEECLDRISICSQCENFIFDEFNHTLCKLLNCNISLVSRFKFKQCPLEKW